MRLHIFGAIFGLMVTWILHWNGSQKQFEKEKFGRKTGLFSMLGEYCPCVFLEVLLVIQVGGLLNHKLAKQNLKGNPLFSRDYISLDVLAQF